MERETDRLISVVSGMMWVQYQCHAVILWVPTEGKAPKHYSYSVVYVISSDIAGVAQFWWHSDELEQTKGILHLKDSVGGGQRGSASLLNIFEHFSGELCVGSSWEETTRQTQHIPEN